VHDDTHPGSDDVRKAFAEAMNERGAAPAPLTMWWSLGLPDGGGAHIGLTDSGDGWKITDVYVHGPEVFATTLLAVPLSQVSAMVNLLGQWDPATIADAVNSLDWGQRVIADPEQEPSLADLREWAQDAPAQFRVRRDENRPKLTRPDGSDPDGFAARVAAAYREYVQVTRSPAVEIAKEAAVPVATARSWVREARRRGKLPAGRQGKAG
jgi:hypothetical protein